MSARKPIARELAPFLMTPTPGLTQAAVIGNIPLGQLPNDQVGGALFLITELRMRMDVAPDVDELGGVGTEGIENRRGGWIAIGHEMRLLTAYLSTDCGGYARASGSPMTMSSQPTSAEAA